MRLTVEKVLILKSCDMFSSIPEDSLAEIAAITDEISCEPDDVIFEKGDIGKSMYIVINGKVKVHDGDKLITTLGERDIFGEMAVLDPEARSATVTTVEETTLFKIEQDPFYELLAEHPDVTKGILKVLCKRLRKRN